MGNKASKIEKKKRFPRGGMHVPSLDFYFKKETKILKAVVPMKYKCDCLKYMNESSK
ncbi:hypothetical protein DSECCO2_262580 [anaerobic digester metagenome]